MSKYRLDLSTLLIFLADFQENGTLVTTLEKGLIGDERESCQVIIDIVKGQIVKCSLSYTRTKRTRVLDQNLLQSLLHDSGVLEWDLLPLAVDATSKKLSPAQATESYPAWRHDPLPRVQQPSTQNLSTLSPGNTSSLSLFGHTPPLTSSKNTSPSLPLRDTSPTLPLSSINVYRKEASSVPHLIIRVEPALLNALSRKQRRVLVLVDGKRSISDIGLLLFSSSEGIKIVLDVIKELEKLGFVKIS